MFPTRQSAPTAGFGGKEGCIDAVQNRETAGIMYDRYIEALKDNGRFEEQNLNLVDKVKDLAETLTELRKELVEKNKLLLEYKSVSFLINKIKEETSDQYPSVELHPQVSLGAMFRQVNTNMKWTTIERASLPPAPDLRKIPHLKSSRGPSPTKKDKHTDFPEISVKTS